MIRKLHIGGKQSSEGWEVLDALPGPHVAHVCNANDLSLFSDNTFAEIYASHVAEHLDYKDELSATLVEWMRVLQPGGKLYVSVPDLDVLSGMILEKNRLTVEERYFVMRMIFGGHVDQYDYHVTGLNEDFLTVFLRTAGYINITKVERFGLFDDTSNMVYKGVPISLNLIARKPRIESPSTDSKNTKVGRNDPCPCGSGRKYKKCHGVNS